MFFNDRPFKTVEASDPGFLCAVKRQFVEKRELAGCLAALGAGSDWVLCPTGALSPSKRQLLTPSWVFPWRVFHQDGFSSGLNRATCLSVILA